MILSMELRRQAGWLLSVGFILLTWATPLIYVPVEWVKVGTALSTLLLLALQIGLVATWTRSDKLWLGPLLLLGGALAWGFLIGFNLLLGWFPPQGIPSSKESAFLLYQSLRSYFLILAAVGLGRTLALLIREPNLLVPVVPFAAIVDILTVFAPAGVVHQLLEKRPAFVQLLSVPIPSVGSVPVFKQLTPVVLIGLGDFVFLGLYFACLYRFRLRERPTLVGMYLGLVVYLLLLLLVPRIDRLPALVPMAIVFLGVNWRHFRLTRGELISSAVITALASALLGWYFWR